MHFPRVISIYLIVLCVLSKCTFPIAFMIDCDFSNSLDIDRVKNRSSIKSLI